MVPAPSDKVPRVSSYSGYCHVNSPFAYGAFTLSGWLSQNHSARLIESIMQSEPRCARTPVWALPRSLAATYGIDVSFSSSGYLDVSVHRVPFHTLWIGVWMAGVCPAGFPHSDICGSMDICSSPQLFAAYHVFLRLLVPRHPPCALYSLTIFHMHSVACVVGLLISLSTGLITCHYSETSKFGRKHVMNACIREHVFVRIYLARSHSEKIHGIFEIGSE